MSTRVRIMVIISILFGALVLFPVVVVSPRWITVGCTVFYSIILASSWNFIMGYTGIFSFGHMASMLIGAYTTALLTMKAGVPPAVSFMAGGFAAAFANFLLGALCLRFRGFYLTLVTWAFAEMIIVVINNEYLVTGGSTGMLSRRIFWASSASYVPNYYLGLAIACAFLITLYCLTRSKVCIYLKAIRDDEAASEVMGVDTTKWKIFSFTFSGFWAGIGGGYYLNYIGLIDPTAGNLMELGIIMLMVIMGGIGTLAGPIVGAVFVVLATQLLFNFQSLSMIIFAVLMIVILRYFRGGIVGGMEKLIASIKKRPLL